MAGMQQVFEPRLRCFRTGKETKTKLKGGWQGKRNSFLSWRKTASIVVPLHAGLWSQ